MSEHKSTFKKKTHKYGSSHDFTSARHCHSMQDAASINGLHCCLSDAVLFLLLLLLVRQMETPVSSMKVAVHRRFLRLP